MKSFFDQLAPADLKTIQACATRKIYQAGERVFSEGDAADYIYLVESGQVSIFIQKFSSREEIQILGAGEHFGEMAVFFKDRRTASVEAIEHTVLLSIGKEAFLSLLKTAPALAERVNSVLARRNEELLLKEKLIDSMGMDGKHLHIGIKGDPSMRETAFSRERHDSIVDRSLPELAPCLEELLLNRCVFEVYIGFNNGEIRTSSIFNPFGDEIHPVSKILDETYIDRHFPKIGYAHKTEAIRRIYRAIRSDVVFAGLPPSLGKTFEGYYETWRPVGREEVAETIARLHLLRSIPNFYLRNITIGTVRDAIHMQFNCDGTHIVSTEDYRKFFEENL